VTVGPGASAGGGPGRWSGGGPRAPGAGHPPESAGERPVASPWPAAVGGGLVTAWAKPDRDGLTRAEPLGAEIVTVTVCRARCSPPAHGIVTLTEMMQ
jgi:hypothetical protein